MHGWIEGRYGWHTKSPVALKTLTQEHRKTPPTVTSDL